MLNLRSTPYGSGRTPWSGRNPFGQGVTPVRLGCPGAANHHDPVMTSYLPLTCLAATLARMRDAGLARQPAHGPVPLEPAEAPRGGSLVTAASDPPRFALRQRRVLLPYRSSHTGSWFAAYDTRLGPAADIPGPAGPDNRRNPVTTSYHPGGESGRTLIDTQMGDHDDNRDRSARPPRVPLCGG